MFNKKYESTAMFVCWFVTKVEAYFSYHKILCYFKLYILKYASFFWCYYKISGNFYTIGDVVVCIGRRRGFYNIVHFIFIRFWKNDLSTTSQHELDAKQRCAPFHTAQYRPSLNAWLVCVNCITMKARWKTLCYLFIGLSSAYF